MGSNLHGESDLGQDSGRRQHLQHARGARRLTEPQGVVLRALVCMALLLGHDAAAAHCGTLQPAGDSNRAQSARFAATTIRRARASIPIAPLRPLSRRHLFRAVTGCSNSMPDLEGRAPGENAEADASAAKSTTARSMVGLGLQTPFSSSVPLYLPLLHEIFITGNTLFLPSIRFWSLRAGGRFLARRLSPRPAPKMAVSLGPEEEIRIMLEQVRAAAQNEEKSALLDALLSMADCGPDICESFFTALSLGPTAHKAPPGNLFELCLDILSDSSAAIAGQVVQVLLIVSQKVGLGMPALRRMMQQLFNDSGEWSENARQIVLCTARMAQLEGDAKSRAANGAEPLHFFVLDGVSSGLYLGGDSNWAWSEGYTFAAWVWKDGNEPGDVTLLHLVGGEVEDSVLQLVIRTDKRGGGSAAHLVLLVGHGARLTQVDTQVAIPTSKWTRVALAHEYNKVKTSVVTTWVDDSSSVTALKYPAQQSNVRAYAGCSSYSLHGANHPGAAHAQQARRFKGLLGTVSLWNKALSYSDVAFAHTLDARNSGEARGQDDEGERPRPRYCASPGSVVFPPASQNAGNKEQRSPLLTCNSCAAGALRVGGRAGLIASLETLGHLDVLMWMLRLAVNESSPDAEQCVQARPWSRAPLQRALACDLLGLTESLITHSALVKAMLRSERGGLAKRLVAGVTQALSCTRCMGRMRRWCLLSVVSLTAARKLSCPWLLPPRARIMSCGRKVWRAKGQLCMTKWWPAGF